MRGLRALAFVLVVLLANLSRAQDLETHISEIQNDFGTRAFSASENARFNFVDCDDESASFASVTVTAGLDDADVEVWVGEKNSQCQLASNRSASAEKCAVVGAKTVGATSNSFSIVFGDLLDQALLEGLEVECDSTSNLAGIEAELYVFDAPPSGDVATDAYAKIDFRIDDVPPQAPNVISEDQEGDSFTMAWESPGGSDVVVAHRIFIETQVDSACECLSGASCLVADEETVDPSFFDAPVLHELGADDTQTIITAGASTIDPGGSARLFVTRIDEAGNQSNLSEYICITRPSAGACGLAANTGESCSSKCSFAPYSRPVSSGWLFILSACAFVVGWRRRQA